MCPPVHHPRTMPPGRQIAAPTAWNGDVPSSGGGDGPSWGRGRSVIGGRADTQVGPYKTQGGVGVRPRPSAASGEAGQF